MDKVSVFESSDFGELRIIVDPKGDVWFVASDVAKSLGYINAKDAVKRHVDDDDSMLFQVSDNQWGVKRSIDINSFEKQEKVDGLNFLYNPNNDRMRNGHIIIDGTGLFKQIMKSGT